MRTEFFGASLLGIAPVYQRCFVGLGSGENGKSKRVSTQEALILRLREKALKGDARALETLLTLARTHNEDFADQSQDRSLVGEDQAILDAYLEDGLARRLQSHGIVPPTDADDRKGEEEGQ